MDQLIIGLVDALTHLNYAFAYLNPETYQVMTMDVATPVDLFDRVAALKTDKPELKIFISIGGWTFSDNNTVTQPVFGEIARSASARQAFASNVLTFLDEYGFDGVDIDWYVCITTCVDVFHFYSDSIKGNTQPQVTEAGSQMTRRIM